MGFGFFDAIIIIFVFGALVWMRAQRHRGDQKNADNHSELASEVRDLRERVRVLERIATQERDEVGLAREIERLRD